MSAILKLILEDGKRVQTLENIPTFDTGQFYETKELAEKSDGEVYSWKCSDLYNWLERGYSRVDVFCLVVVPRNLPDYICMPNDEPFCEDDDDWDPSVSRRMGRSRTQQ